MLQRQKQNFDSFILWEQEVLMWPNVFWGGFWPGQLENKVWFSLEKTKKQTWLTEKWPIIQLNKTKQNKAVKQRSGCFSTDRFRPRNLFTSLATAKHLTSARLLICLVALIVFFSSFLVFIHIVPLDADIPPAAGWHWPRNCVVGTKKKQNKTKKTARGVSNKSITWTRPRSRVRRVAGRHAKRASN